MAPSSMASPALPLSIPRSIPQELVDMTVDHLFDDVKTLTSCALVNSSWLPSARTHLFHDVTLTAAPLSHRMPKENRLHPDALYRALKTSPHSIGPYIRNLRIIVNDNPSPTNTTTADDRDASLLAILKMTSRVQNLEFSRGESWDAWSSISENLAQGIAHVMQQPTITSLILNGWSFDSYGQLSQILSRTPALKQLDLSRSHFSSRDSSNNAYHAAPVHLTITTWSRMIPWLVSPQCGISTRDVKRLTYADPILPMFETDATPLLQRIRETVEQVDFIRIGNSGLSDGVMAALANCPQLRILSLGFTTDFTKSSQYLVRLLSKIHTSMKIEKLILRGERDHSEHDHEKVALGWHDVDAVLAQPNFASLRRVEISCGLSFEEAWVPGLKGRGLLAVSTQRLS